MSVLFQTCMMPLLVFATGAGSQPAGASCSGAACTTSQDLKLTPAKYTSSSTDPTLAQCGIVHETGGPVTFTATVDLTKTELNTEPGWGNKDTFKKTLAADRPMVVLQYSSLSDERVSVVWTTFCSVDVRWPQKGEEKQKYGCFPMKLDWDKRTFKAGFMPRARLFLSERYFRAVWRENQMESQFTLKSDNKKFPKVFDHPTVTFRKGGSNGKLLTLLRRGKRFLLDHHLYGEAMNETISGLTPQTSKRGKRTVRAAPTPGRVRVRVEEVEEEIPSVRRKRQSGFFGTTIDANADKNEIVDLEYCVYNLHQGYRITFVNLMLPTDRASEKMVSKQNEECIEMKSVEITAAYNTVPLILEFQELSGCRRRDEFRFIIGTGCSSRLMGCSSCWCWMMMMQLVMMLSLSMLT